MNSASLLKLDDVVDFLLVLLAQLARMNRAAGLRDGINQRRVEDFADFFRVVGKVNDGRHPDRCESHGGLSRRAANRPPEPEIPIHQLQVFQIDFTADSVYTEIGDGLNQFLWGRDFGGRAQLGGFQPWKETLNQFVQLLNLKLTQ